MKAWATWLAFLVLAAPSWAAALPVNYLRDIKPLLAKHCFSCHGARKQKGNLRLDTAAAALQGGDSGAAIVPGKSQASPLVQSLIGGGDIPRMPPKGPRLTAAQIALLKAWIDSGAKAPLQEKPGMAGQANGPNKVLNKRGKKNEEEEDNENREGGKKAARPRKRERKDKED